MAFAFYLSNCLSVNEVVQFYLIISHYNSTIISNLRISSGLGQLYLTAEPANISISNDQTTETWPCLACQFISFISFSNGLKPTIFYFKESHLDKGNVMTNKHDINMYHHASDATGRCDIMFTVKADIIWLYKHHLQDDILWSYKCWI